MGSSCPACGATVLADASFCHRCGAAIRAEPAAGAPAGREGRKVVTALFADVVGSTTLGERLDPEDYRQVVGDAVARMVGAIEEYGGLVQDLAGDGALGIFGIPIAHEDDAERAALAALRLLEAIAGYEEEVRERWELESFAVRVGIETGLAVLGPVGGGGTVEFGAMGDVLNTAARLQASAAPGSALVGALTQRLIEPLFEWGPPETLELKGKQEPVTAYPLRAVRPASERTRRIEGAETRLIGRERELSLAEEALAETLGGRGAILFLEGEGGIGKTRLVRELRELFERAAPEGVWLQGRCVSYGESIPHLPLRGALREWLAAAGGGGDERAALERRAGEALGERAAELTPFLASLLGLPQTAEEAAALDPLTPEARHGRMHEALRTLLGALAERTPTVFSIDDLHWADAASLAILEPLLESTEESRLLLVLAARDEPRPALVRIRETARRELPHRTRAIDLEPLARGSDRGFLAALIGDGTLPAALEHEVLTRAGGNPFFLEQLILSLVDAGALARTDGGWRFQRDAELELPQTVERVILARIDRLPAESRDLLEAASVLGREFQSELLEEIAGREGTPVPGLGELLDSDFLRERRTGGTVSYFFRHQIILETVGRGLLRERRRTLHARAADALERLLGERVESHLGVLANHRSAAGQPSEAFEYHRRAAVAAARISAREEAIEHFTAALAEAERMDERPDASLLRELRLQRAELLNWAGDVPGAARELREVIAEARESGDRVAEMDALSALGFTHKGVNVEEAMTWIEESLAIAVEIGDRRGEVRALNRLALCQGNLVRVDHGLELSRRALTVAREADDDELVALALDALKLNLLEIGSLDELARTCAELERVLTKRGDLQVLVFALMEGAYVHIARAEWDAATARLEEAMALSRRIGDRIARPLMLEASCYMHRARGDFDRALAAGRQALALCEERPYWEAWVSATLGWTLLDLFAIEDATRVLERGLESAEFAGVLDQRIRCAAHLARARAAQGRVSEARELAARGEELCAESSLPKGEAHLLAADAYLSLARVRLADGDPGRARALLAPLLGPAGRHGWVEVVGAGNLVLARCELAEGEVGRAGELTAAALEASADRLPGVAREAHALAAELATEAAAKGD